MGALGHQSLVLAYRPSNWLLRFKMDALRYMEILAMKLPTSGYEIYGGGKGF
jgi:hypothetical protein